MLKIGVRRAFSIRVERRIDKLLFCKESEIGLPGERTRVDRSAMQELLHRQSRRGRCRQYRQRAGRQYIIVAGTVPQSGPKANLVETHPDRALYGGSGFVATRTCKFGS